MWKSYFLSIWNEKDVGIKHFSQHLWWISRFLKALLFISLIKYYIRYQMLLRHCIIFYQGKWALTSFVVVFFSSMSKNASLVNPLQTLQYTVMIKHKDQAESLHQTPLDNTK